MHTTTDQPVNGNVCDNSVITNGHEYPCVRPAAFHVEGVDGINQLCQPCIDGAHPATSTNLVRAVANRNPLSAGDVRSLWQQLLFHPATEPEVLATLRRHANSNRSYSPTVQTVIDAIVSGDRRVEAAAFRQLECSAPFGFPSETSSSHIRFDPYTGTPVDRYSTLDQATQPS